MFRCFDIHTNENLNENLQKHIRIIQYDEITLMAIILGARLYFALKDDKISYAFLGKQKRKIFTIIVQMIIFMQQNTLLLLLYRTKRQPQSYHTFPYSL